jgi:hypothetical protein
LVLLVVGVLLTAAAVGAAYWYARPVALPRFAFLGGREPDQQRAEKLGWGRQDVAVYGFAAERAAVCRAARAELVPLGYIETGSPYQVPASQDKLRVVTFAKARGRTFLSVHIAPGYSVPTPGIAEEVDWVHVEIRRSQGRLSPQRWLRRWWRKLTGKRTPRPTSRPATP